MRKGITIKISGEVQGVGYRNEAYWVARKLHVAGFVMNEPEGTVYAEAEGEEQDLQEFLAWCKKGPITARVTNVEVQWSEPHSKFTGFRIG
jgi:acylphosphatase